MYQPIAWTPFLANISAWQNLGHGICLFIIINFEATWMLKNVSILAMLTNRSCFYSSYLCQFINYCHTLCAFVSILPREVPQRTRVLKPLPKLVSPLKRHQGCDSRDMNFIIEFRYFTKKKIIDYVCKIYVKFLSQPTLPHCECMHC